MRDFSIPPYDLAEIGAEVKRIGDLLQIHCDLAHSPKFREMGYFSLPTLSYDIARMAGRFGVNMPITGDLAETGIQLQQLIALLRDRGIVL